MKLNYLKTVLLVATLFLVGCNDFNSPEVIALNKQTLSGNGSHIGNLPDGREVVMYMIDRGDTAYPHFIYVVNGSVTVNSTAGKTNAVTVFIDGVEYAKVSK